MKIRVIPIDDSTILQHLVIQQIGLIEGQVQVIEIGINTEWGPIILGCDQDRRLVVLLLDVIRDENLLPRLIGVYRWITRVMPLVSRFYTQRRLDGTKVPRIVSLAPGFSQTVQDNLVYLAFKVEPYTYRGVDINGEFGILLQSLGPQAKRSGLAAESEHSDALLNASHLTEAEIRFFEEPSNHFPDFHPNRSRQLTT